MQHIRNRCPQEAIICLTWMGYALIKPQDVSTCVCGDVEQHLEAQQMAFPHTKEAALGNIGLTSSQQTTLLHLHACIDTLSCATYYQQ